MEANFFRSLAFELKSYFSGKRIEKIYEPVPGVWSIKLGTGFFVILGASHQGSFLYTHSNSPQNPATPSARVMWFRKRLKNQKIRSVHIAWEARQMAFMLSRENHFLILDPAKGLELKESLPSNFDREVQWPSLAEIRTNDQIWRSYPQLSPPLRKTLKALPDDKARTLLHSLVHVSRGPFYVYQCDVKKMFALAWKSPLFLQKGCMEKVFEKAEKASRYVGQARLSALFNGEEKKNKEIRKYRKGLEKKLAKVEADQERMQKFLALKEKALLIQNNLHGLDPRRKTDRVELIKEDGSRELVDLNPRFSIIENMEQMFKKGAKGKRGKKFLDKRQAMLERQLKTLDQKGLPPQPEAFAPSGGAADKKQTNASKNVKGIAVHRFQTSDGFLVYRGKNDRANHGLVTKLARPYDLWFHAQNGPGAHVLLRRNNSEQSVPEQSMLEAAVIAGLASYQRNEKYADIMCALIRDVSPIKGGRPGQVTVKEIQRSFHVRLDPEVEERCAAD